jgi:peptidoglycan/xylan/chitin deacetylase (PgdA/CDA1 family)
MIRIVKTPGFVMKLFPSMLWRKNEKGKILYLTFDDGPTREATPYVLSALNSYNAKATFFCVGDNVNKNRDQFQEVISQGHSVGNHTYNHLVGWKSDDKKYFQNIEQCTEVIKKSGYTRPVLYFRPPHGRLTFSQYKKICKEYRLVMWDILAWDFNPGNAPGNLLKKINRRTGNGSIIVFHDSQKALPGLKLLLEPSLEFFSREGYQFRPLDETN